MSPMLRLMKKELRDHFQSPLTYVLCALFTFMTGWLFFNYIVQSKEFTNQTLSSSVVMPIFGNINFIFLFLAPLLTMKSFSEEWKNHTMDLLLTSRLKLHHIILGKFFSLTFVAFFLISFTLLFPIILYLAGYQDLGVIATSYLGVGLSVMAYVIVGMFTSSLTDNQIFAAVMSFCILLSSMLLVISVQATQNQILGQLVQYSAIAFHYESFVKGVIKSYNLVYFFSFIFFFFLMIKISLQSRKW